FAIVFISALGDRKNTVKQAFVLSLGMSVIAVVVFWWALQLQLPLFRWG
ncbi:tripartite tricarboxylate transporter TctB family protein, partial [Paraburkholderia sp. SIMBA_009]